MQQDRGTIDVFPHNMVSALVLVPLAQPSGSRPEKKFRPRILIVAGHVIDKERF